MRGIKTKILDSPFEGWTTIEEAADIIGRNKRTVWTWADAGKIACFPVGRKMRVVNIEEVREFAEKYSPPRSQSVDKKSKTE